MKLHAYAIVLAGGYGTRFWPASRRARPKQFLALTGKESLLQQTYRRLTRLFPPSRIYVVGNAEHRRLLQRQLPRVPAGRLLLEPAGRNTTAAIALAAAHIRAAVRGDAILGVFPADHVILEETRFQRVVRAALTTAAAEQVMVVLGIPPTEPNTGYGYIERGAPRSRIGSQRVFLARRFTEKPDPRTAARYSSSGRYFWNSGMFFWRLSTFDALLRRHLPRTHTALERLSPNIGGRHYAARLGQLYRRLENISVDYALAEPAAARGFGRMLVADIGWSDLGSWSALYDLYVRVGSIPPGGNMGAGPGFLLDCAGLWIEEPRKFVVGVGIRDIVVVDTPEALLLCRRDRAQDVGKIVRYLERRKLRKLL